MARRAPRSRNRTVITPEGVALPLVLATRGARAAALLIDLALIGAAMIVTTLTLIWIAGGIGLKLQEVEADGPKARALQALVIVWIIAMFLFRNAWFLFFELGPRGATPGKRMTGIRVAARATRTGSLSSSPPPMARSCTTTSKSRERSSPAGDR